jgi:hypothetical protein
VLLPDRAGRKARCEGEKAQDTDHRQGLAVAGSSSARALLEVLDALVPDVP